jgi:hypothetical protein
MNPIQYALNDIKHKIPQVILHEAFFPKTHFQNQYQYNQPNLFSLDHLIKTQVIEPRVLTDCNLIGGKIVTLPLTHLPFEVFDYNKTVWRIPFDMTNNQKISRVLNIVFSNRINHQILNGHFQQGGSLYTDLAQKMLDSHLPIPTVSNADVFLIGENVVMANILMQSMFNMHLRCVLENDEAFNDLPKPLYKVFSKLCELAIKAYIYNQLIISLDMAYLHGGQSLGQFSNIVQEYADSNTLYEEYYEEKWKAASYFSDPVRHRRHLSLTVGGRF